MELQDYVRVIRAHWLAITAAVLLGGVLAYGWTMLQPKVYTASGSAIITTGTSTNIGDALVGDNYAKSRVKSYLDIAKSRQVASFAIDELGLKTSADALIAKVRVNNPLDTAVLRVSADGASPKEAQALAEVWIQGMTQAVADVENSGGGSGSIVQLQTLDSVVLPAAPSSPNTKLNVLLGLMLGAALGVAYALIKAALDRRLRTVDAIERNFDIPVLGAIPHDANISKRGVARVDRDFHTAEAVRQIRTNLQFMDIDNPPRIIVVTSAEPGEGKSTVSIALAEAIAESGAQVILIDADLRRPSLVEYLGLVPGAGLTDVLVGRVNPDHVLQPWGNSGRMQVMGAGSIPPNPSELLGSTTMRALLERLDPSAIILIDTPPLLPVTDAAILTARTDGALVVARAGSTTIDTLDKALANLERVKGRALGVILDGVSRKGDVRYSEKYSYDADPSGRSLRR